MPMPIHEIESLLCESFPDAKIDIKDLAGDNDHFQATIISKEFLGKTRIQQHQMVYGALQGKMGSELHALALKTGIPLED
ncbi:MAG: BolA/IbaG family iron-sulfur metabolism protein [Alphaproteobacteria bacterium]|jgi:stress-induced morphogen|nr:BolA/IbaG family iron-sulfur metabolism protein [Alphaproteobacteria bacterium]